METGENGLGGLKFEWVGNEVGSVRHRETIVYKLCVEHNNGVFFKLSLTLEPTSFPL